MRLRDGAGAGRRNRPGSCCLPVDRSGSGGRDPGIDQREFGATRADATGQRQESGPLNPLKYCTSRSCFSAASRLSNVPRLRRFPVFSCFLRE